MDILAKVRNLQKEAAAVPPVSVISPKTWHSYHKVGTVLGVAGLGASLAGFAQSQKSNKIDMERKQIEAKSLAALQAIHKALSIKGPESV